MRAISPVAWREVSVLSVVLAVVLAATSSGYGWHRDELYFRMLAPAWGYVDQPPLAPLTVHAIAGVVDEPWAVRIPALLLAVGSVWVVAAIAREFGAARGGQILAGSGVAFGLFTLIFGHTMLTASVDLVVWPLVLLLVLRWQRTGRGRWIVGAGVICGLSSYNKLLIVMLLAAVALGFAVAGPRRIFRDRSLYLALGVALLLALPNVVYQAVNGWPQLAMGSALAAQNGDDVRVMVWVLLLVMLGPLLAPLWVYGMVVLWRDRRRRWLAIAMVAAVVFTFASGSQPYYHFGVYVAVFAAGCAAVAQSTSWRRWRVPIAVAVALDAVFAAVIALPVLPEPVLAHTPIPSINQVAADQVGWPDYVSQIAAAAARIPSDANAVIFTTNYGEAGALARFGAADLPPVFSGHNQLAASRPDPDVDTVLFVGEQIGRAADLFSRCDEVGTLHNRSGVANEEEGQPIELCSGFRLDPDETWDRLGHLS